MLSGKTKLGIVRRLEKVNLYNVCCPDYLISISFFTVMKFRALRPTAIDFVPLEIRLKNIIVVGQKYRGDRICYHCI